MILSLFKKSHFVQITWVILITIILAVPGIYQTETIFWPESTLFTKISCLAPWLKINWIYQIITNLLLILLAFYVKAVFSKHQLVHYQNYLPALLIIVLFNFSYPYAYQLAAILNLFLLALSFSFLLDSFDDEKPDNSIFSASLFLSLASFLSYSNFYFLILIWVSFFVFQNYSWRYLPISIVGLLTPYIFLFTWLFWFDKMDILFHEWNHAAEQFYQFPQFTGLFNIIILSILGFFIFASLSKIIPETPAKIIAIRRKTNITLWFLLFAFYPLLFHPDFISKNLITIPLAGLLGYYFRVVKMRRKWMDLLFTLFIIIIIANKYFRLDAFKVLF